MSKRCPESGEIVVYLDCQECETKSCKQEQEKEEVYGKQDFKRIVPDKNASENVWN